MGGESVEFATVSLLWCEYRREKAKKGGAEERSVINIQLGKEMI